MAEDRELDERLARLESRLRVLESAADDPWSGQSLAPPGPKPALAGPQLFPSDLPSGLIVMWGGAIADIPVGWTLCDGGNDSLGVATPDLSGSFIVGYDAGDGDYDAIADAGGFKQHGTTENGHTDHTTFQRVSGTNPAALGAQSITHSDTDNRPPYYTLAFIRKD